MRIAETVTFGGSGMDRGAGLRKDPVALQAALRDGLVLPVWRGKPLVTGDRPGWLVSGHPALAHATAPVFLGLDDGQPRFAADISDWAPEAGAEAVQAGFLDPSVQHHPALGDSYSFVELRGVMTALTPRDAELVATAKALLQWHRSHRFCAACGAASDMVQGGWQRSCPACGAQHFPRTDPVVIMLVTYGNSVLLGRSPGWPEGMFSLLAGFVEPGESMEAAVRREVQEETGVRCGPVSYLASQPWPFPASLMIGARTEALGTALTIDPEEIEQARWVTREELISAFAGLHPEIKPARNGAIAHFILRNWLADRLD
ncbi:NAD(+) diphosphatase [Tabrizicola sp.]|uniref:NAD(+) diphosphatase n=1 Tax=Tabrizicola sp. TaxID=2005166 RepID=UPI002621C305|nr:NAD(+) diphosphatase [Tabrizicola sp.]MDM7933253.1 NAD(+) diphosphatase [Tabrizicola sp.]